MEPQKERKYLVVKLADLRKYFSDHRDVFQPPELAEERIFKQVLQGVHDMRNVQGKKDNNYVVINEDESYIEQVWQLILAGERKTS